MHVVSPGISECESRRRYKEIGISEQGAEGLRTANAPTRRRCRIGRQVRVRSGAVDGHDSGVVWRADAVKRTGIQNAERSARLECCDSRKLPAIPESWIGSSAFASRNGVRRLFVGEGQ